MLLNYFPHIIWKNEATLSKLKDKFYYPILMQIGNNAGRCDNRQFLSLFQGMTIAGESVFKSDMMNLFLNSFI